MEISNNTTKRRFPDFLEDFEREPLPKTGAHHEASFVNRQAVLPANIIENETDFLLEMAVPGLTPADICIHFQEGTLTVKARASEKENESLNYRKREFVRGPFMRCFALPAYIAPEDISAAYSNGILTLTLKKKETKDETGFDIQIL